MKKIFALPIMAIGLMVSQAWAETCKVNSKTAACEYKTPVGCYSITTENSDGVPNVCAKGSCSCTQLIDACKKDGALYSFASDPAMWSSAPWGGGQTCGGSNGGTLEYSAGCDKYCKWSTGCTEIKVNSEFATCEAAIANCETNAPMYSDAACNTWVGGKDPNRTALGCCKWNTETSCFTIWSDETGATGKVDNCKSGSNQFWNGECLSSGTGCPSTPPIYPAASSSSAGGTPSSSSGGPSSSSGGDDTPIISYNKAPVTGLSVISFARNLQIASDKDATVALFNMQGKRVFSQKVLSGTTTLSLQKQRQGVYYAVVRSGSQKQTVKVILK